MSVIKPEHVPKSNILPSVKVARFGQSIFDPDDLYSDDEKHLTPPSVAETTPGRNERAARLLTALRLYLNSPSESPKNWGQVNPNRNDYQSDPM